MRTSPKVIHTQNAVLIYKSQALNMLQIKSVSLLSLKLDIKLSV